MHEIRDIHDDARPAPRRASAPFMRSHPLHLVSLGFGTGLAPFAPGLVGSLFGWLSFVALAPHLSPARWLVLIAAGFALGLVATHYTARALGGGRPRAIVWDQILATWIVMLLVTPASFGQQLAAFVLLRLVLRLRPPPMRRFDRRFDPRFDHRFDHRLKAGFGIMIDDLVAAFLTLLAIATWHAVFSTPG
ncbi:phosphatidylglycerophosphatase A family protein [Burkholderia gladioli]|uniref:phosphatidylglycerophosphatase A family protein n=1 Tax=Burkholderia gladioli TaxID=28095 RepID=UPI001FC80CFA|nr:phosphatidylglycerophosphatase A [Burkholderia gladioli]